MDINQLKQLEQHSTVASTEGGIDLRHYLTVLWSRKYLIILSTLVFAVWAYMGTLGQKPFYTATLTMILEEDQQPIISIEDMYRGNRRGYQYVETQFGIMKSRSIAEQVVRKTELHKHPHFQHIPVERSKFNLFAPEAPKRTIEISEEQMIKNLIGFVSGGISIVSDDSSIIELSFTSQNREISIQVVNALAEVYIDDHLRASVESTEKATAWLTSKLEDLYSKLKNSEAALQSFRESEQLIELQGGVITIEARELEELNSRYSKARNERIALEPLFDAVQSDKNLDLSRLRNIPAILNYASVQTVNLQLNDANKREAELAKRYGPKHPKMIAIRAELDILQSRFLAELNNVVKSVEADYQLSLTTEQGLERELAGSKLNLQSINRKEFRLQELQREVDANQQLYEMFFQRVKETTDASGFTRPHARILDPAIGARASSISKMRGVVIAALFGMFLAMGIAIAIDFLDDKIKSPTDAQERLYLPFLGIIPLVKDVKGKKISTVDFPYYWYNTQSSFSESIRTIRTGIVLESLDSPAKVIVITSTMPGEGKSTVALNLGSALGQMENVLVIGADLRRPTLASKLKMQGDIEGLSDYLGGEAKLGDCIHHNEEANCYILPAGKIPSHPLEMLSSAKFKELLERLKTKFDRIVIDSAPTHAVSDALVLSSNADTVVYVVKANETPAKLIRQGLRRLRESTDVSVGIVLNDFDESKLSAYAGGGYYYDGYYSSRKSG